MNKWISGLAIASLAMPSIALGAPDSDVQRALKASKIGDYGFDELLISCQVFSGVFLRTSSTTYKVGDDTYVYVLPEEVPTFRANLTKYSGSRFSSDNELQKIIKSPLTQKIQSYFLKGLDDDIDGAHAFLDADLACRNNAKVFLTNSFPQTPTPTPSKAIS